MARKGKLTARLMLLVEPEIKEQIKRITNEKEVSMNQWITQLIKEKLEKEDGRIQDED